MSELYLFDQRYRSDYGTIAGLDEAGRGPLAGPLVACALILPESFDNSVLTDSKKISDTSRRTLKPLIETASRAVSLGIVTASEIDKNRMSWAVRASFKRAMKPLLKQADAFLVDGNSVTGLEGPSRFLVKGDSKSLSIAAASIIAKVTRDDIMLKAHKEYPEYGFNRHKGYGTPDHIRAIREHGPCPLHRMSFAPLSAMYQTGQMSLFPLDVPNPGRAAETRAARYYKNLGYTILEKNWRSASGEIDLIVKKNNTVTFVEVKSTHTGHSTEALGKIDRAKIGRIRNAAGIWIAESEWKGLCSIEAALVTGSSIELLPVHHF
ncbi:MAG: ribonuclease HII [bacterium]|nr:ribonuclease HII [bacterium]